METKNEKWEKLVNFSHLFFAKHVIDLLGYSIVSYYQEEGNIIVELGDGTLIKCSIEDKIPMSKVLEKPVK